MSKKSFGIVIISVALIIIILRFSGFISTNYYYSPVTSGLVIKKEVSDDYVYTINVKRFGETKDEIINVKIIVSDENVWNLIEEERFYFITYEQKNNETPILGQIEHNDEFGKINGKYFNELNKD